MSLQRLGVDQIDIYRLSRLDPNVPSRRRSAPSPRMVQKGSVRHIGLSEVESQTRRPAAVHPIGDLQIEYSLISRGIENDILVTDLCIGATAFCRAGSSAGTSRPT